MSEISEFLASDEVDNGNVILPTDGKQRDIEMKASTQRYTQGTSFRLHVFNCWATGLKFAIILDLRLLHPFTGEHIRTRNFLL